MMDTADPQASVSDAAPLADPLAEARRIISRGDREGVVLRVLGGAAVCLRAPGNAPLLKREVRDIDLVTPAGGKRAVAGVFESLGYVDDEQFNAFHGAQRQIYVDLVNRRKVDVFIGSFSMCHAIPIADRLDRDWLTIPLAELLLTKLQIVQLTERDERDIFNLCFHHELADSGEAGIDTDLIARLCAQDWGLWRTCKGTIERCRSDLDNYTLGESEREVIARRLEELWQRIEAAPKTSKWRLRNRVGDRVRWYNEPEEEPAVG
jgi:hypothetical protein